MPTLELAQIEDAVWALLERNTAFFPEWQVRDAINEAVRVLNLFTGYYQDAVAIPGGTRAGRFTYDAPVGVIVATSVLLDGKPLFPYQYAEFVKAYPRYFRDTSNRSCGPTANWVAMGISKFMIHPAEVRAGRSLVVRGVVEPDLLVNATDKIGLEDEWVPTVVRYAVHVLQYKEGGAVFHAASAQYQRFLGEMKERKIWESMKMPQFFLQALQKDSGQLATGDSK